MACTANTDRWGHLRYRKGLCSTLRCAVVIVDLMILGPVTRTHEMLITEKPLCQTQGNS